MLDRPVFLAAHNKLPVWPLRSARAKGDRCGTISPARDNAEYPVRTGNCASACSAMLLMRALVGNHMSSERLLEVRIGDLTLRFKKIK